MPNDPYVVAHNLHSAVRGSRDSVCDGFLRFLCLHALTETWASAYSCVKPTNVFITNTIILVEAIKKREQAPVWRKIRNVSVSFTRGRALARAVVSG